MLSRGHDCEHALAEADVQFGSVDQHDSAAHLFTAPEFDRLARACYLALGKYAQAATLLANTAAQLHDRQKSRAIVLGNLALAHVRQREVDAAAGALHQAIDLAAQTRGAGGMNLIFKPTRAPAVAPTGILCSGHAPPRARLTARRDPSTPKDMA